MKKNKKERYNSSNALYWMDWLTLAPMPVKKWWTKVSRHEHASLMLNNYIETFPHKDEWYVRITLKGKRRLEMPHYYQP